MNIDENFYKIKDTDKRHSDLIDSIAYMFANREAEFIDRYMLLFVKKKPTWIPDFVYRWMMKKILVVVEFKK